MTRENKLAMVIGFGLLLFVGILVSDHLSARSAQINAPVDGTSFIQQASLPGGPRPATAPPVIFGGTLEPSEPEMPRGGEYPIAVGPVGGLDASGAPGLGMGAGLSVIPEQPATPAKRTHTVAKGEYPSDIAKKYYGKRSLGEKLAKHNGIDPSKLKIGMVFEIPPIEVLDPTAVPQQGDAPMGELARGAMDPVGFGQPTQLARETVPEAPRFRTVKVADGDTLYKIAERVLGDKNKWKELLAQNPGLKPENLKPGTELRYALANN